MKLDRYDEYPIYLRKPFSFFRLKTIVLILLAAGLLVSGIVNLGMGGQPWALYVLGGELVFWFAFFDSRLIEQGVINRLLTSVTLISLYLLLIDALSGFSGWSINIAVPNIYLGAMVVSSALFLLRARQQRQNFLSLYTSFSGSIIMLIVSLSGALEYRWPLIVLGSYSFGVIAVTLIFFRKPFLNELKKRWIV